MTDTSSRKVVVIGAGEMGAAVARRLREGGARVTTSLQGRSASSAERVRLAGIEAIDDDNLLVRDADFVLAIVPPGAATEVAQRFKDPLLRAKPLFVECNAIAPATTRHIEEILRGVRFIDAGIIGGPPMAGTQDPAKGPRFYASARTRTRCCGWRDSGSTWRCSTARSARPPL